MGIFKSNWFTHQNHDYNAKPPVLKLVTPQIPLWGSLTPYYEYDYWPVPTSWARDLFLPEYWNNYVRKLGSKTTEMGPCIWGRRIAWDAADRAANYKPLLNYEFKAHTLRNPTVITARMTELQQATACFENSRRQKGCRDIICCRWLQYNTTGWNY